LFIVNRGRRRYGTIDLSGSENSLNQAFG